MFFNVIVVVGNERFNCVIFECRYIVGWCRVSNKMWYFNFLWVMVFIKINYFDLCFFGIICNKVCVYI